MKILQRYTYTNDMTHLALKVIRIQFIHPKYTKIKGILFNKYNGIVYETKNYSINNDLPRICGWKIWNT